jgi:UPF0042 nucleotide-binding protein
MQFVIVTGMSGAGKSTALKMLEDAGFFCVDNLPIQLIAKFAELTFDPSSSITKVALGVDIRSGKLLDELEEVLKTLKEKKYFYKILFLDAKDEILIKRYKETRRAHPLAKTGRVDQGIYAEREKLEFIKKKADYIINTSQLLTRELKEELGRIFIENKDFKNLYLTILSFGFKNGIPADSDLVFDVRFLPNPYYIDELRPKTGNDREIREYVMSSKAAWEFLDRLEDMMKFLIPHYIEEGKNQLVVSIGCTGGKHRSVTLANELYERLKVLNYGLKVWHRDIEKDALRGK